MRVINIEEKIEKSEFYCDFCNELIEVYIQKYNRFKGKDICNDCKETFREWYKQDD